MKQHFKNMKLASKLAVIISLILVFIFATQISITSNLAKTTVSETIASELQAQAEVTGARVEEVFDTVTNLAETMTAYAGQIYASSESIAAAGKNNTFTSEIYHVPLKQVPYQMESYVLGTARSALKTNSAINGIGIMFEPKMFASNINSYAFYVNRDNVDTMVSPYGDYEEYSKEEFYSDAVTERATKVLKPYDANGKTLITVSTPIIYKNAVMGVIRADMDAGSFQNIRQDTSRYASMYSIILDDNFRLIYNSKSSDSVVGKTIADVSGEQNAELIREAAERADGGKFTLSITKADGSKSTGYFTPISVGGELWWVLTALDTSEMQKAVSHIILFLVIVAVIALAVMIAAVIFLLKKMLAPIGKVMEAAEKISSGNFDIRLEADTNDEIGLLTKTFDHTAATLRQVIQDISRILNSIAGKNLDLDTNADYVGDLGEIEHSLNNIIGNLNDVMNNISRSADQVAHGSDQVASGSQALSQGATEQASSIQELAATINEISEQVKDTAENARQANDRAGSVGGEIEESSRRMKDMLRAMDQISDSSREIEKIIKTIEDLAFQTNILALNAAVEAARAGEAGKGFAVVADEVRNLASKSSEASKNTSSLIDNSLRAVDNGTKIAGDTAESLNAVVDGVHAVADTIGKITKATEIQSESILQITQGIDQISSVIQTNSATAEESAAASEELNSQAQILNSLVREFKVKNSSGR